MSAPPRADEVIATEVVRRVLGATVTEVDDNSRPGMVDALLELPDGTTAALEVTTSTSAKAMAQDGFANRYDGTETGGRWTWYLTFRDRTEPREAHAFMRQDFRRIVAECEATGIRDTQQLRGPLARRCREVGIRLRSPGEADPGRVHVGVPGVAGFVRDDVSGFVDWLDEEMATGPVRRRVDKLTATGLDEQHLFLWVHERGSVPFGFLDFLMGHGEQLPERAPATELHGVWVCPRFGRYLARWTTCGGWERVLYGE